MIPSLFKIGFRNLVRKKSFSILNIGGLAIGMASAMLILLWIQLQISPDRFHVKLARLYEVWSNDRTNGTIRSLGYAPEIMASSLKKDYPEVEEVTRIGWTRNLLSDNGERKLMSTGAMVDPGFLTMFSFPLLRGIKETAMNEPYSIVLTEKLARALFNTDDVVGKTVRMGVNGNYKVTGLLKDIPFNSQFAYIECIFSYKERALEGRINTDWSNLQTPTFVLLKPNSSLERVNSKIKDLVAQHTHGSQKTEEFLYPVSKLWLYSEFQNGKPSGGRITIVRTFGIVAFSIILIACINFMNLSTARSEQRAKEVGIRKVAGALKSSLIFQFLIESIVIAFAAGLIALILLALCLPWFNQLLGAQIRVDYGDVYLWGAYIALILFTGVLAGSYPAFFLSGFKPITALKGKAFYVNAWIAPRKVLVVLQFTCTIFLIICTITITQQIKYAQNRNMGYDKDQLANVYLYGEMEKQFDLIKKDLLETGAALSVAKVQAPMNSNWSSSLDLSWEGKDPTSQTQINQYSEAGGFVQTSGLQLIQGRDIDIKAYPADSTACVINESALRLMNFKNPIGELIYDGPISWHVVGVIKDYIQESPYQSIKPMIIKGPKDWMGVILIRLNRKGPINQNLASMEKVFKRYNPAYPFEYSFTDQEYAAKFADELQIGKLAFLFAGLALFISCVGLFGLAAYMAQRRIKEIGVRKILGATVFQITALLSLDFIKWVALALLIASPIAWWAMHNWLNAYYYRIQIQWWVFALAGILSMVIASLTVAFESIKTANANPVKSLRSE